VEGSKARPAGAPCRPTGEQKHEHDGPVLSGNYLFFFFFSTSAARHRAGAEARTARPQHVDARGRMSRTSGTRAATVAPAVSLNVRDARSSVAVNTDFAVSDVTVVVMSTLCGVDAACRRPPRRGDVVVAGKSQRAERLGSIALRFFVRRIVGVWSPHRRGASRAYLTTLLDTTGKRA